MSRKGRIAMLALGSAALVVAAIGARRAPPPAPVVNVAGSVTPPPRALDHEPEDDPFCSSRPLHLPSGAPARIDCRDARAIITQVRARLATTPNKPGGRAFAEAVTGWLDPHGLWSAAPDAPARALIAKNADRIVAELESRADDCAAAREVAVATHAWIHELRPLFDRARQRAAHTSPERALELATDAVYQDDPVTRPSRVLAADLGERAGRFEAAFGPRVAFAATAASERLLPTTNVDEWTKVVLAAAVRSYVPLADAHGQWAPLDEEWSLYAADAAVDPGPKLWGRMMRTALGVRVLDDPSPPLEEGDLVLSVGGIATAGLSVEQLEQLARLESVGGESVRDVVVLRKGDREPRMHTIELTPAGTAREHDELAIEEIVYGNGHAYVVVLPDVPDALGETLASAIAELRSAQPVPAGILLDLRGNGGGSTDGAAGALGVFLPGVPSFPMRRRGGIVEVQRAISPTGSGHWPGPVASLVDGYTASAAEMIAGGLASYGRGPIVGAATFGKGCIQEYFDDRAGAGVLRLTTMVFALPDGAPLQGVGLSPSIRLPLPAVRERESLLGGSPPPWRGPDVRDRRAMGGARWPAHGGRVGPCKDPDVCAALERLGSGHGESRRTASARPAPVRRPAR